MNFMKLILRPEARKKYFKSKTMLCMLVLLNSQERMHHPYRKDETLQYSPSPCESPANDQLNSCGCSYQGATWTKGEPFQRFFTSLHTFFFLQQKGGERSKLNSIFCYFTLR
jgi:hypothetical protein